MLRKPGSFLQKPAITFGKRSSPSGLRSRVKSYPPPAVSQHLLDNTPTSKSFLVLDTASMSRVCKYTSHLHLRRVTCSLESPAAGTSSIHNEPHDHSNQANRYCAIKPGLHCYIAVSNIRFSDQGCEEAESPWEYCRCWIVFLDTLAVCIQ
jgi:hypothetical protein